MGPSESFYQGIIGRPITKCLGHRLDSGLRIPKPGLQFAQAFSRARKAVTFIVWKSARIGLACARLPNGITSLVAQQSVGVAEADVSGSKGKITIGVDRSVERVGSLLVMP